MTKQDHARFVQAVRYSPSGNLFASAGFDGKVFIYDGSTSELVGEVGSPAHSGGVYGVTIHSSHILYCYFKRVQHPSNFFNLDVCLESLLCSLFFLILLKCKEEK